MLLLVNISHMLTGYISVGHLASVKDGARNLSLKSGLNQVGKLRYCLYGQLLQGQMFPVTVTLRICSRRFQEPTFKVSSKSGQ